MFKLNCHDYLLRINIKDISAEQFIPKNKHFVFILQVGAYFGYALAVQDLDGNK